MPLSPEKIKSRRESLNLTQSEAAELAGMPQPRWAEIESGANRKTSLERAERIAAALRLRLGKLLA